GRSAGAPPSPSVLLQAADERGSPAVVARHDQNRVVAGNRSDRFGQLRAIDGGGERLRVARGSPDYDEVAHANNAPEELRRGMFEGRARIGRADPVGAGPLIRAVAGALHQAEIFDVARNRRLRGAKAALMQTAAELLLGVQRLAV